MSPKFRSRVHTLICTTSIFYMLGNTSLADTQTPKRVRVAGNIQRQKLIHEVPAKYPPEAEEKRVEGVVHLEVIIATDGTIKQLQVISGHPLLVRAALEAVRQWRYEPTKLNGAPVEVVTSIAVVFKLP